MEGFAGRREIRKILEECRKVAVVGLSDDPSKPSYTVAKYLLKNGYGIIPVNPNLQEWEGIKSFASLEDIGEKIDVVDIFRRPEHVPEIVESAIKIGAKAVWMQEGVIDEEAAKKARDAGLLVVMDRCMRKEHLRSCARK